MNSVSLVAPHPAPTRGWKKHMPSPKPLSPVAHQLAESLGNAMDAKDHSTRFHSEDVAVVSQIIALELGFSTEAAETIHIAGHLHDIGKIGIPDAILNKQEPLTNEEWHLIRQHPVMGYNIVHPIAELAEIDGIAGIILHHHERYDGSGYPDGLRKDRIPFGARIIAVADSLSAMMQDRPYSPGKDFKTAVEEIKSLSGTLYAPDVVQAFLKSIPALIQQWHRLQATHSHNFSHC